MNIVDVMLSDAARPASPSRNARETQLFLAAASASLDSRYVNRDGRVCHDDDSDRPMGDSAYSDSD